MVAIIPKKPLLPPLTLTVAIHSQQARSRLADLLRAHFFSSLRTPHDIGDQWEMYLLDRRLEAKKEKNSFLAVSWEFVVDTLRRTGFLLLEKGTKDSVALEREIVQVKEYFCTPMSEPLKL